MAACVGALHLVLPLLQNAWINLGNRFGDPDGRVAYGFPDIEWRQILKVTRDWLDRDG